MTQPLNRQRTDDGDQLVTDTGHGSKAVRETLEAYGFRFSKSMGQNFLVDANIPEKIVRLSGIDKSCGVLEAGPGLGALTSELSKTAGQVTAVELDRRLVPILREKFERQSNVEIVQGDILKLDLAELVRDKMPGMPYHLCANIPYNITTPALTAFIEAGVFESITVMVQREVARRICAKPASPEYGAFTVFVSYHAEPEPLFDVPPECFIPRPGVFSSVVRLKTRRQRFLEPEAELMFFRVVRAAFGQRRKTLVNALISAFGGTLEKGDVAAAVSGCGFDARVRGETLGTGDFMRLSKSIGSLDKNPS